MAKKNKVQLTPEELAAKKIRKSNGWTRFWAIVLSFALVAGVFAVARSNGIKASEGNEVEVTGTDSSNSNASNASSSSSWDDGSSSSSSDSSSGSASSSDSSATSGSTDAATVANLLNSATKAAVDGKAGYDWERHCSVTDISVGAMTSAVNSLIKGIDENSDLNSVVGGFLGNGDSKETVAKGETLDTKVIGTKDDGSPKTIYHGSSYTLKATTLKAEDIQNLKVDGDTYEFTLPDSTNPDRNGNNALARFSGDIAVGSEVEAEIKSAVSVASLKEFTANYNNIKVKAVITDGKLVSLEYSLKADATLKISLGFSVTGTGNLVTNAKYSNFVY